MISAYLTKSIEDRNIDGVRGALKGVIDADPAFKSIHNGMCEFDEAVSYVLNNGISEQELFEVHDDQYSQEENVNLWTREYYFKVLNYLTYNFSGERISHLKKVGQAVMSDDRVYREKKKNTPQPEEIPAHTHADRTEQSRQAPILFIAAIIVVLAILAIAIVRHF